MTVKEEAEAILPQLLTWQQTLHEHPEASGAELFASRLIRAAVAAEGWQIEETGLNSGVLASRPGGSGCPLVLRCDIDAVAGDDGPAHRCGHDFHTAALLGAARLLADRDLPGPTWLLFQPAEETLSGAAALLAQGLAERIPPAARFFGLHNRPELPLGVIGVKSGPLMAAKRDFCLTIRGRSGHGGMPQLCVDPLVAAAAFIQAAQTVISRNADPLQASVCAVCSCHCGSADNFAPDSARLTGSLRSLDPAFIPLATERLRTLARHTAAAYGCTADLDFVLDIPLLDNDPALLPAAHAAAASLVGAAQVVSPQPCLASEDFAVYASRWPAFFYWLGATAPGHPVTPWHSPDFTLSPQSLPLAAALYAETALCAEARAEQGR